MIQTVYFNYFSSKNLGSHESEEIRANQIKNANVIILLYDLADPESKTRINTYWLDKIKHNNDTVPIIIVGNKLDLLSEAQRLEFSRETQHRGFIYDLVKDFPQVEMGIECSGKLHEDLTDLLYCAQRAVLYPILPLYSHSTKELQLKYICALKRIFRISDSDNDGYLNNHELSEFQKKVFNDPLQDSDIFAVKEVLISEVFFSIIN